MPYILISIFVLLPIILVILIHKFDEKENDGGSIKQAFTEGDLLVKHLCLRLRRVRSSHLMIALLVWITWELISINENLSNISSNTYGIDQNTTKHSY
ncbi:hypothetical protein TUM19329_01550 [Legionella antarctica]|uniref:Uncharacterized protein n=1 Tax=Legionella antarctica TaxID=2708020 RepID=A0A6F8SZD3_9GAMM|nr:hypothetical protein TUM19329_01550 [Legionella antarctica]